MSLWYCPNCDKSTYNWRKCQRCGAQAVYQRFVLWPVPHEELPTCYEQSSKNTVVPSKLA